MLGRPERGVKMEERMQRYAFWSIWIALAATAFGVGRLIGVSSADSAAAPAGPTVAAVSVPASQIPTPNVPASPAKPPAVSAAPGAPAPAPAAAPAQQAAAGKAQLAPEAKPGSMPADILSALPAEQGVDANGDPLPSSKPRALPKGQDGWISAPSHGADEEAAVTVLIVSDFQCPVCRRVVLPLRQAARELGSEVRFEFKQHPLESHPRALPAAIASMAAHRQGKFWEYHDLLFGEFGQLSDADFIRHAERLELDMAKFKADLADPALEAQAKSEGRTADLLGARGTPAFFINGKKQVGWGSYFGFKGMITRELEPSKALMKQGMSALDVYKKRVTENSENPDVFIRHYIEGELAPVAAAAGN
jgi:protein-disulfide isomerase